MNRLLSFVFLVVSVGLYSQFNNTGNFHVFKGANVGFHTNVTNNGDFNTDESLVGFYGDTPVQVLGSIPLNLFDAEIFATNNMFLLNSINVENNVNFVLGNVLSPLNDQTTFLNFQENALYNGDDGISKVTGVAAISNKSEFTFPVGDQNQLRPLVFESNGINTLVTCAYLSENPSNPSSIPESFDTSEISQNVGRISNREFWVLNGDIPSTIVISWNFNSNLSLLTEEVSEIVIVGWRKSTEQWEPLSDTLGFGDLTQGIIQSNEFLPSEYGAITFGTIPQPLDTFAVNNPTLGDYFLSPNNDGVNEGLVFDNLEDTGSNTVRIYNKFGQKIFEQQNYTNEFRGFANTGNFIVKQDIGLPEGVYYYTIDLPDLGLFYQGFVFLDR